MSLAGVGVEARESLGGGSRSEWIVTLGGQALAHDSSAFLRTFCKPADGSTAHRASSSVCRLAQRTRRETNARSR